MISVPAYEKLRITTAEPLRIQGHAGYEVRAEARDPASGEAISLVQWMRFPPGGGFLRMLGIVRTAEWASTFPRFRAIRDGVTLR
jgi:hypothetical protein